MQPFAPMPTFSQLRYRLQTQYACNYGVENLGPPDSPMIINYLSRGEGEDELRAYVSYRDDEIMQFDTLRSILRRLDIPLADFGLVDL